MCAAMVDALLETRNLSVRFTTEAGPITAVRGLDLTIDQGKTLAIVGESGSGKSAFAKAILRQHQPPFVPDRTTISGNILWKGRRGSIDLLQCDKTMLREVRSKEIAMIFQEAMSALNPVMRIGDQVAEAALERDSDCASDTVRRDVVAMLDQIGINNPEETAKRYPHQLSGGQRQRVMIAIAAVRRPKLLIADEPTTALDVTVQRRLLGILRTLQTEHSMAMLFITHDLGVVALIADEVAVMYAGQIVEQAPVQDLFERPRHPYTAGLLASLPDRRGQGQGLKGHAPEPRDLPSGCAFRTRCPRASGQCEQMPKLVDAGGRRLRCWHPTA